MIDMNLEAVNSALAATVRKQEEEIKVLRAALEQVYARINEGHYEAAFAVARTALGGSNG